jgi:type IV secretory pathway TraG/TraD family ATPase VirD4
MRALGDEFLTEAADAFQGMADREFSAVINTAQASLEPWRSPRIAAVTAETSPGWSLDTIRHIPTSIFLCVPPRRVLQYASVLRVIIGQHVEALMHDAMEPLRPPFLFMLDEFPLLRYMESLETALKVGAGYGLKLWLFCQDMGQLRQNWPNAEGILSACQLKAFMNVNDPATEKYVLSLLPSNTGGGMLGGDKGKAKRLLEPGELFGPEYEDKILVLKDNVPPALLEKAMAFRLKPERFRGAA